MMSLMRGSLQGQYFRPQCANSSLRHPTDMNRKLSWKVSERETAIMIFFSFLSDAPSTWNPINRRHTPFPHPATSTADFSAEQNTITTSTEIRHVDLSHSSPNENFPTFPFRAGGWKDEEARTGQPLAMPTRQPPTPLRCLDKWKPQSSLPFFSIKCLPFGMLPRFMIIKTFACQRRRPRGGVIGGWVVT